MKHISLMFSCMLAFVCLAACAQNVNYSVDLTANDMDLSKAYLVNLETGEVVAEAAANHNRVHFEGLVEELPFVANIVKDTSDSREGALAQLIVDGMNINITVGAPAEGANQPTITAEGSELTKKFLDIRTQLVEKEAAITAFVADVRARFTQQPTEEEMAELEAQYQKLADAYTQVIKDGIKSNIDNKVSMVLLVGSFNELDDLEFVQSVTKGYAFAGNPMMKPVNDYLASASAKLPGSALIDFELPDAAGTNHKLSEYVGQGKYVLVDFWASWCGPCRAEMPNVVAAYNKYHEKGFDILSLSFDSNREAWLKAITDLGMVWNHLSDLKGWESLAAQKYGIRAIPSTILFDPEGKVVAADLRGAALSEKLEELLK